MVWNGANYPQEHESAHPSATCGHEGAMYHVRDDEGVESVSCVDCIASEMETLRQGVAVRWEIERLTDDEHEPEPRAALAYEYPA